MRITSEGGWDSSQETNSLSAAIKAADANGAHTIKIDEGNETVNLRKRDNLWYVDSVTSQYGQRHPWDR